MAQERRRVFYEGRVQGVGFRATARSLSRGFAVTGFVRNLSDGRVELLAEGEPGAVDAFLAALAREMDGRVRSASSRTEPTGDPPLSDFTIRS